MVLSYRIMYRQCVQSITDFLRGRVRKMLMQFGSNAYSRYLSVFLSFEAHLAVCIKISDKCKTNVNELCTHSMQALNKRQSLKIIIVILMIISINLFLGYKLISYWRILILVNSLKSG